MSLSKGTCSVLSSSNLLFLRVQARGDTALPPYHPLILLSSDCGIMHVNQWIWIKEYEQFWYDLRHQFCYILYTSRERLSYQTLHLEYPRSADGTKPHIQPFYHQLSLVNKNNEVQFSEHYIRGTSLTKYRVAGKLAIFQAHNQMMPYRLWLNCGTLHGSFPQQISKAKAMVRMPVWAIWSLSHIHNSNFKLWCWAKHKSSN